MVAVVELSLVFLLLEVLLVESLAPTLLVAAAAQEV
jgi:hypothetical protein